MHPGVVLPHHVVEVPCRYNNCRQQRPAVVNPHNTPFEYATWSCLATVIGDATASTTLASTQTIFDARCPSTQDFDERTCQAPSPPTLGSGQFSPRCRCPELRTTPPPEEKNANARVRTAFLPCLQPRRVSRTSLPRKVCLNVHLIPYRFERPTLLSRTERRRDDVFQNTNRLVRKRTLSRLNPGRTSSTYGGADMPAEAKKEVDRKRRIKNG